MPANTFNAYEFNGGVFDRAPAKEEGLVSTATAGRAGAEQRIVQATFGAGMYRNGPPELVPPDGVYDALNCLLDLLGGVYKRGGAVYRSSAGFGAGGLRWIWDGVLKNGGQQTLVASPTEYARLKGVGEGWEALGHGGQSAAIKPAVYEGVMYFPGGNTFDGTTWGTAAQVAAQYTIVANRLVAAEKDTVWLSEIGKPGTFAATEYVKIPGGVTILALEAGRDSCIIFTTAGVWVLSNLAMKITDANGNVQWRLDHFSNDLVLWGVGGIAGWEGNIVVPGGDAVWLINRGVTSEVIKSFARISDPIRDLYRSYVKLGYQPGQAAVYENHYLLPVIGGGKVQDVLVCRLDKPPTRGESPGAWTHFTGTGAAVAALTARTSSGAAREPELLGAEYGTTSRAITCNYFNPTPTTAREQDGTVPEWALETRGISTGQLIANLVGRLRARYVCWAETSSPTIQCRVALESAPAGASVWGAFVWGVGQWASAAAGNYEVLSTEAPPNVDASKAFSWRLHKKRRVIRFRLSCTGVVAELKLKTLEIFVRAMGRL